jgi:D-aspartate ligase
VPGGETHIVSYHAFIDDSGRVVGEFSRRRIRTRPADFGISTAVRIEELSEVRDEGLRVLRAFGFTGVAKVDFKESPGGDLALLEVNPRFNLWHHPAAVAGVNLPAAVYRYLTSGSSSPLPPARDGVEWVQVWGDRAVALASGVKPADWLRFVRRAEARRAFHLDDPGAALGALNHGLMQKLGLASRQ